MTLILSAFEPAFVGLLTEGIFVPNSIRHYPYW